MKGENCTLYSGGAQGAESEFGAQAEKFGIEEVNFTFEGHQMSRSRGVRFLTQEELLHGDVSLSYVSKLMNRSYKRAPLLKKVLQSIWHQINCAEEVFVVGAILEDKTVKGGHRVGRGICQTLQQTAFRVRSGKESLVQMGVRHLGGGATRDHPAPDRRDRHPVPDR